MSNHNQSLFWEVLVLCADVSTPTTRDATPDTEEEEEEHRQYLWWVFPSITEDKTMPGNEGKRSCFEIDAVAMNTVKFFDRQNFFVSYFRTRHRHGSEICMCACVFRGRVTDVADKRRSVRRVCMCSLLRNMLIQRKTVRFERTPPSPGSRF